MASTVMRAASFESHILSETLRVDPMRLTENLSKTASSSSSVSTMAKSIRSWPTDDEQCLATRAIHRKRSVSGLRCLVLKYTTALSTQKEENTRWYLGEEICSIGRCRQNQVCVETDVTMAERHAMVRFDGEKYFIHAIDGTVALRVTDGAHRDWPLIPGTVLAFASSVATVMTNESCLLLRMDAGPLTGSVLSISPKKGATLGRANENDIVVPDKELSRIHVRIYCDQGIFYARDLGSTNGSYLQLTGPYAGECVLSLGDHLLLGRTGLSVNRFDIGLAECCGPRPRMEDRAIALQDLFANGHCSCSICAQSQGPNKKDMRKNKTIKPCLPAATFVAVFDGHGGPQASTYLRAHLHCQVARELILSGKNKILDRSAVKSALTRAFLHTDDHFIHTSEKPSAGSTAVCVLIIDDVLYCANVGDSRALLGSTKRGGRLHAVALSSDHTPCRHDEAARIRAAGGWVIHKRVMGELSVSRAFGDAELKRSVADLVGMVDACSSSASNKKKSSHDATPPATPSDYGATSPRVVCPSAFDELSSGKNSFHSESDQKTEDPAAIDAALSPCLRREKSIHTQKKSRRLVVAEPEIMDLNLTQSQDQFILLASDGLFDVFSNDEAIRFVHNQLNTTHPQDAAEALVSAAIHDRGSRDNVTALILDLRGNALMGSASSSPPPPPLSQP